MLELMASVTRAAAVSNTFDPLSKVPMGLADFCEQQSHVGTPSMHKVCNHNSQASLKTWKLLQKKGHCTFRA